MIIPPDFYTKERVEWDLYMLKVYYKMCEELKLTNDNVKRTFMKLSKIAGNPIFMNEVFLLSKYINKRLRPNEKQKYNNNNEKLLGNDYYYKLHQ